MKKSLGAEQADDDEELTEALAVLISSTRTKRRPLPLTEVAHWLDVAVSKLGSYAEVADRLGLSSKMVRQFSSVRRLSKKVQDIFQSRELDSVDAATHLAMLPTREQLILAEELAAGKIDTADLRAVVQLWQGGRSGSAKKILAKVKASKTKQIYVAEFVVRGSNTRKRILSAFQKYIPSKEIVSLRLEGALGRLVLTQNGKRELVKAATSLGTTIKEVIPRILQG